MKQFLDDAYGNLKSFVDAFANSASGIAERKEVEPASVSSKPYYVCRSDNYLEDILDNFATKKTLKSIATKYYSPRIDNIVQNGSKLSDNSFPRLWNNFEHCCKTLGIKNYPDTYITDKLTGINGLSIEVNDNPFVLLSFQTAILLNDAEQRFLIGHELGHIQQGNLVCHTVNGLLDAFNRSSEIFGSIISDAIDIPLKRWCRQTEFNADRAGLICCENIDVATQLLTKITEKKYKTTYAIISELYDNHPLNKTRIELLKEYDKQLRVSSENPWHHQYFKDCELPHQCDGRS